MPKEGRSQVPPVGNFAAGPPPTQHQTLNFFGRPEFLLWSQRALSSTAGPAVASISLGQWTVMYFRTSLTNPNMVDGFSEQHSVGGNCRRTDSLPINPVRIGID